MNNMTLARLILSGMYHLAQMVCYMQMGMIEEGRTSEKEFLKLVDAVSQEEADD